MNIEQAKNISIMTLLDKLNFKPQRINNKEAWFLSPFREEKTASFKVDLNRNTWHDFGSGKGGDILDFSCNFLQSQGSDHNKPDGLRYIKNMIGMGTQIRPVKIVELQSCNETLKLQDLRRIDKIGLIFYAQEARMYGALAVSGLAATLLLWRALGAGSRGAWIGYALVAASA